MKKSIFLIVLVSILLTGCGADHTAPDHKRFSDDNGAAHCRDIYAYAALGGTQVFAQGMNVEAYTKPLIPSDRRRLVAIMDHVLGSNRTMITIGGLTMYTPATREDVAMYDTMAGLLSQSGEQSVNSIANACLDKFAKN